MATHSSVLAWRIPGMGEPGGLLSMGSHRVGHDWSNLAATAAAGYCMVTLLRMQGRKPGDWLWDYCWRLAVIFQCLVLGDDDGSIEKNGSWQLCDLCTAQRSSRVSGSSWHVSYILLVKPFTLWFICLEGERETLSTILPPQKEELPFYNSCKGMVCVTHAQGKKWSDLV